MLKIENIIVLVKYVADVDRIPDDAWDTEKGTLIRGRLKMEANPLDDRALRMALDLKKHYGCSVFVLSMGPSSAEEICRRAVAYGADDVFLVSDGFFAGSDTLATANTLKAAVEKIIKDKSLENFIILAGMQSPDGDTAQVPMQTAKLLGCQVLPYISGLELSHSGGELIFECLSSSGREKLQPLQVPFLGTVTDYAPNLPDFNSFEDISRASECKVALITNKDLNLSANKTGLSGSWTRVIDIFPSRKKGRLGRKIILGINPAEKKLIKEVFSELHTYLEKGDLESKVIPRGIEGEKEAKESYYKGDYFVLAEFADDGCPTPGTMELVGQARLLSRNASAKSAILAIRDTISDELSALFAKSGADKIIHIIPPSDFTAEWESAALAEAIQHLRPQALLIPATIKGRVIAPLLAAEVSAGLTADCTGLEVGDYSIKRKDGNIQSYPKVLFQTRPALGGNIMATILSLRGHENNSPQMATVRPGVFEKMEFNGQDLEILEFAPSIKKSCKSFESKGKNSFSDKLGSGVKIEECDVLISVGLGIGNRENFAKFAEKLKECVAEKWKVKVGISCSRAAVEAGITEYSMQVGQTGKTVRPKIYFALGISGSVQHYAGMCNSGRIIAVNTDPSGPISEFSDYFFQGDISQLVPALIDAINSL